MSTRLHPTSNIVNNASQDNESDYGSDFSPDDITLIDRYLIQANSELVPPLAIVDTDDEPGRGHFAYVPRKKPVNNQDIDSSKEVFNSQDGYTSTDPSFSKLVGATLASPPSFAPVLLPSSSHHDSEFDDEALESWDVWKNALPKMTETPVQAEVTTIESGTIGTTFESAFKQPVEIDLTGGESPLQRFRSPPKKPLSVTDLVSPAWCEQQYYYTLSKYGKIRPTVAMKRGSEVHAKLEEEVFTKVQVPIQSREDSWALQLWNLINSLRTLRETGMTRELQVWGVIQGQVVAGVIDELRIGMQADEDEMRSEADLDKLVINEALQLSKTRPIQDAPSRRDSQQVVFLTDMKTRSSKSIPRGFALKGTIYQLMLYHTLLQDLVSHRTDFNMIFGRYRLDPYKPFTDTFLEQMYKLKDPMSQNSAQAGSQQPPASQEPVNASIQTSSIETPSSSFLSRMGHLADGTPTPSISLPSESNVAVSSQISSISSLSPAPSQAQPHFHTQEHNRNNHSHLSALPQQSPYTPTPLSPSSLFHRYNTLSSLLTFLNREITLTFPHGAASLSPYLHACYRDKNTSEITGRRVFMHDADVLQSYVTSEMAWWTGERETRGVPIEEAYKCSMCEFAPSCTWRAGLVDEEVTRRKETGFVRKGWQVRSTASPAPGDANVAGKKAFTTQARKAVEGQQSESEIEKKSEVSERRARVPGAWISETNNDALKQRADGVEVGGGRKGQERTRSVV